MILAIDTATRAISIALLGERQIVAESTWLTDFHHTVELSPALDLMFKRANITPADLQAIAVSLGPGSFTGLRIGMAVAKGLSLASDPPLPLIGIPTLDIVAAAQPHLADHLYAVVQAGRGRISAALYAWKTTPDSPPLWKGEGPGVGVCGWHNTAPPFLTTWKELSARIDQPTQIGGEIDSAGREFLASMAEHVTLSGMGHSLRRAGFLAELAYRRFAAGEVDDPATLAPIYLR